MDCRVKPGNDDCDCCSRVPLTLTFSAYKTHFLIDYNPKLC